MIQISETQIGPINYFINLNNEFLKSEDTLINKIGVNNTSSIARMLEINKITENHKLVIFSLLFSFPLT